MDRISLSITTELLDTHHAIRTESLVCLGGDERVHPIHCRFKLLGLVEDHATGGPILLDEVNLAEAVLVVRKEVPADFNLLFASHCALSFLCG